MLPCTPADCLEFPLLVFSLSAESQPGYLGMSGGNCPVYAWQTLLESRCSATFILFWHVLYSALLDFKWWLMVCSTSACWHSLVSIGPLHTGQWCLLGDGHRKCTMAHRCHHGWHPCTYRSWEDLCQKRGPCTQWWNAEEIHPGESGAL